MFGNNQIEKINERFGDLEVSEKNFSQRIRLIEEQLKPEPAFKDGQRVNFFLVGEEFEGEIIEKYKEFYPYFFWTRKEEQPNSKKWIIKYLDDNKVVQRVEISEEDIWTEENNEITDIYDELFELKERVKELETKKK